MPFETIITDSASAERTVVIKEIGIGQPPLVQVTCRAATNLDEAVIFVDIPQAPLPVPVVEILCEVLGDMEPVFVTPVTPILDTVVALP